MKYLAFSVFAILFFSCKNEMAHLQKIEDEIFVIHDEVMPKLGKLNDISKKLKNNIDATDVDVTLRPRIAKAIEHLEEANTGMWDWMNQYKQLETIKDLHKGEVEIYLKDQLEKVKVVKDNINNSMKEGSTLLELINK